MNKLKAIIKDIAICVLVLLIGLGVFAGLSILIAKTIEWLLYMVI